MEQQGLDAVYAVTPRLLGYKAVTLTVYTTSYM
jgi:hypothetical protein